MTESTKTKIEWKCELCKAVIVTDELTCHALRCGCGCWMEWRELVKENTE